MIEAEKGGPRPASKLNLDPRKKHTPKQKVQGVST